MLETVKLPVKAGRLKPPVWEKLEVAKNWAAVILADGERDFIPLDFETNQYEVDELSVGKVVEFGADRLVDGPKGGKNSKRIKNRWYGIVRAITNTYVEIERFESADAALLATDAARARAQGTGESNKSLRARLRTLEAERQRINAEIEDIRTKLALDDRLRRGPYGPNNTDFDSGDAREE